MKKVRVEDAVGMVLPHDMTRIVPGKFKGVAFKKGHVVREEDIPELLKLGKQTIYVLNLSNTFIHEDDGALRIAASICGDGIRWTGPSEGKSGIICKADGLLKINTNGLLKINKLENIIVSTIKTNFPCKKDQVVGGTRIIPLIVSRTKIERVEAIARKYKPIISLLPYRKLKVGAVVTGSELYKGLIKDEFDKYVGSKVSDFGSKVVKKILVPDDPKMIADAINELVDFGCELILTTGGLSVDPDDVTKQGVKKAGGKIVVYGSPILPGAMFLHAVVRGIPILGLPACVYYNSTTIFDLVFPRALAGDKITKEGIAQMGHGGFCLNCKKCQYPVCPFGK
ncbi:MAG: molybdopterin-binding protein [Desulfobacterium sp.]|nr:molybdopterin-binding protein [Desulfobacterium sp.]MBU3946646.1 molybdopterin-binding protein [Pseudomonadota bacterium]MBU4036795.1 molybdopterin-binding protein [Pseudomonadota bacterium]